MKTVQHPGINGETHHTCNAILEEVLEPIRHTYIMSTDVCLNANSFDRNGDLRVGAMIDLWNEIDKQMELFDKQQITLKPGECKTHLSPPPGGARSSASVPTHTYANTYRK